MFESSVKDQREVIANVCTGCPVRRECLHLAVLGSETEGVWGGTTEAERKTLINLAWDVVNPKECWDSEAAALIYDMVEVYVDEHPLVYAE
jgi:hypothetical protein